MATPVTSRKAHFTSERRLVAVIAKETRLLRIEQDSCTGAYPRIEALIFRLRSGKLSLKVGLH